MAIISFKCKFIFVKTTKTAGSSLEVYLSERCGKDDIVTPIKPENARHQPRNFIHNDFTYYNHMSATEIETRHTDDFANFFKFCFERHPVDKCLSHFAMLLNSPDHFHSHNPRTWDEYIERECFPIDHPKYTNSAGKLMLDRVYKFEDMSFALMDICKHTNIADGRLDVTEKAGFRFGVPTIDEVMSNPRYAKKIMYHFKETLRFVEY